MSAKRRLFSIARRTSQGLGRPGEEGGRAAPGATLVSRMATKRRGSAKRAGQKKTAQRRRTGARRSSARGAARKGAREARPAQAAREAQEVLERAPEVRASHLRAVEPTPDTEAAEPAGGSTAAGEEADARRRAEAQAELSRRREATVEARPADGAGEFPGLKEIGIELAIGALRLARTIATAPLRLGLALLRSREA